MKWVIIILVLVVGYAIYTGNMGGAKDAANNYNKVLRPGQ
jgi:heme A synthase